MSKSIEYLVLFVFGVLSLGAVIELPNKSISVFGGGGGTYASGIESLLFYTLFFVIGFAFVKLIDK